MRKRYTINCWLTSLKKTILNFDRKVTIPVLLYLVSDHPPPPKRGLRELIKKYSTLVQYMFLKTKQQYCNIDAGKLTKKIISHER